MIGASSPYPLPRVSEHPWKRAAAWLLLLAPLFFASYGFANWVASQRAAVGAIVFEWERSIPFIPWTIVPYWTIDALYGISLFVCTTRAELDVLGRRLLLAQAICVACFLAFPLRFTFERAATDGLFGWMFDVLMGFDKPFNQAPSLHIALLVILWLVYLRHVPPRWRWLVHGWFTLIGASVLTTYQHHFIDIPTGLLAGWLCVWLVPDEGPSPLSNARLSPDRQRLDELPLVDARERAGRRGAAGALDRARSDARRARRLRHPLRGRHVRRTTLQRDRGAVHQCAAARPDDAFRRPARACGARDRIGHGKRAGARVLRGRLLAQRRCGRGLAACERPRHRRHGRRSSGAPRASGRRPRPRAARRARVLRR